MEEGRCLKVLKFLEDISILFHSEKFYGRWVVVGGIPIAKSS